jgi:hypothetical protein
MYEGTSRAVAFAVVTATGGVASAAFAASAGAAAAFVFSFALALDAERPPQETAPKSASESKSETSAPGSIFGEMNEADINEFINLYPFDLII